MFLPLLSVSKVITDGIVRLLQQSVVRVPRAGLQQLQHPEPVAQLYPQADGEVPAGGRRRCSRHCSKEDEVSAGRLDSLCVLYPPAVHVQVHALGLLEAAEVGGHLGLLHGLALKVGQALDQLDALVVLAADEGLLRRLQVQFLQGGLSQ